MKLNPLILSSTFLVISFATANAGTIVVSGTSPSGGATILTGAEGSQTRSREVIRTDTQQFAVGQNFELPAGDTYSVDSIYLKSASGEDFDAYPGNLEVKVFAGSAGSATLLGTSVYDLSAMGGGDTGLEVSANDWAQFQLDSAVTMTGGQDYSFLLFFDSSSGANNDHKWGFRRDDSGIYADGNQWEGRHNATPAYNQSDWGSNPWNNVLADGNDDFMFYVGGSVIPEPSSAALLLLGGLGLLRRRR